MFRENAPLSVRDSHPSWQSGHWLNAPKQYTWLSDDSLEVVTDHGADFWRETHYGFIRDSGHFFALTAIAPFAAQLRVRASYEHLYDQAGMMLRLSERHWVKAGIEFNDGHATLGSVVTDGRSDWATGRYPGELGDFWLRISVSSGVLRIQSSEDGRKWSLMRLSPFPESTSYLVGPMCCTPERAGLKVLFSDWRLRIGALPDLHDAS